jgi:hypothetical protein
MIDRFSYGQQALLRQRGQYRYWWCRHVVALGKFWWWWCWSGDLESCARRRAQFADAPARVGAL